MELTKVLDRYEDPHHSLEVVRVELFLSLRYLCKSVTLPELWFVFPVALWFLLGLVSVEWHWRLPYLRFSIALKKKKVQDSLIHSIMVLMRCRKKVPIKRLLRFDMTKNFSLNVMSPTSNCNSTVAIGASNCPLATIVWNSVRGP